jgi:hypothetical protein
MIMSQSRRPTLAVLAVLSLAVFTPTHAVAQQPTVTQTGTPAGPPVAPAASTNPTAERALKQMIAKLRSVQAAQDLHWNDHLTYTTSMTALGRYDATLSPKAMAARNDSVSVQVIFAGGRGWTGTASHWALRNRSCVVYVGIVEELPKLPLTRADRRTPTEETVPVCDAVPATSATATPSAPAPQPAPVPPPTSSRQPR